MKILVAEDDPITLDALTACLVAEGHEALAAANGTDALALWKKHRPDLLCLDVMMPGIDGFELCRRVRASDSRTPILFLSAKNEEIDVVVGLEIGADDFIRKPFTRAEVMARIRAALRRARPAEPARQKLTMHDLTVWPEELRAERDGASFELTPREAAMLALLFENSGRPVSRDAFLDRCWGMDYFPDSRTLDQHIVALRKKVEREASRP
ncbi:MAG TPA: response regulator transcription factor, partial [Chthoniobacteraceae bacterium]